MKKYNVIIIVLIVMLLGEISYLFIRNNSYKKQENKTQENDKSGNKQEESSKIITDEEIEKLLSYVPFLYGILPLENTDDIYKDAYDVNKISIDTINKEILLYSAYTNLELKYFTEENAVIINGFGNGYDGTLADVYVTKKDINQYLNKAFRIDDYSLPNRIVIPGGNLYLQDDYYLVIFGAGSSGYYKLIDSYEYEIEENDILMIYEKVWFGFHPYASNEIIIYSNSTDMHEDKNVINKLKFSDEEYGNLEKIDINKYIPNIKPTTYKHIFKKDKDGYYWYSTEMTKDK